MEISVCKGVLVRSQDDCTTQLCIKVDRDLGGSLMKWGGGVLSSSALFVSTTTKAASAATTIKAGGKRGRNGSSVKLPDGEMFTIPADVTALSSSGSSNNTSNRPLHHIDMSLATSPSDFSRISLLKEALSTILDPTTRKKLTVNAVTGMQANVSIANKNNKKKQAVEEEEESSSTPLSSLDISSADLESDVDDEDVSE